MATDSYVIVVEAMTRIREQDLLRWVRNAIEANAGPLAVEQLTVYALAIRE